MKRRDFIVAAGALGLGSLAFQARAQNTPRFADMHSHLGFKLEWGLRAQMEKGGMLLVAEKITPDTLLIQRLPGKLGITRQATPGELGAAHVGIGSDLHGLVRTVMPSYVEYALLEDMLARRGMKAPEIEGILGGNYLRVLREAMTT